MWVMHVMKDLRANQGQWGDLLQDAASSFSSRGPRGRGAA